MNDFYLTTEEFLAIINSAIETGQPVVFRDFFTKYNPSWQEILEHINIEYHNRELPAQHSQGGYLGVNVGNMVVRGSFYYMGRLSNKSTEHFTTIEAPTQLIREFEPYSGPALSFVSVLAEPGFPTQVHADPGHTFFWQLQGKSHWHFYETFEDICVHCSLSSAAISDVVLNPGDLLFAPKGAPHTVAATTPRAGFAFRSRDEQLQKMIEDTRTLANIIYITPGDDLDKQ